MDRSIETVFEEVMAMDRASQITIAERIMANVVEPHPYDAELRAELRSRVEWEPSVDARRIGRWP